MLNLDYFMLTCYNVFSSTHKFLAVAKEEKMDKLIELIKSGEISVEDLTKAPEIIENSELALQGLEACKKTISFPLGQNTIRWRGNWNSIESCYEGRAEIQYPSTIIFYNDSPDPLGTFDLCKPNEIFLAFCEKNHLRTLLYQFLNDQISDAKKM